MKRGEVSNKEETRKEPVKLGSLLGSDSLDSLVESVEGPAPAASAADDEMVDFAITLPSDDYRRAYLLLVSRNDDISAALMEFVNERS